ncbi:RabGAP/TBC [Basidiobolus meristosporus CBS 931.73]|uniref:RabGAP/TBC n=1 Tax=Basidiobolus meristosporus CBS 931.73 TaxID=1314790 RepID=A0A1Y1XYU6_9FUNG|nr:RabGAP/TBC [Basidiobolus meristosporus CBS 931.73]|eukprot:ORX90933.1 RabGAP/TBC [Basidiobolus meristosporus CBS 931.73]
MPAQINHLFLNTMNTTLSHGVPEERLNSPTISMTTRSPTLISDNSSSCCDSDIDSIELSIHSPVTPSFDIKDELEYPFDTHLQKKAASIPQPHHTSDFLSDSEFWEYLIDHYPLMLAHNRERVAKKIYQGIPENYRGRVWQAMSQSKTTYLDTLYSQLLTESSPFEADILLDLPRTFPRMEMFRKKGGEGQARLFNVLKAYSVYDPEIGYAQGFGYIVATLLLHMSESEAFCVFVRLMQSHNLREMFGSDLHRLECGVYQFRCLLAGHFPKLVHHLDAHNVRTAMYTTSWFLTLFTNVLPQSIVLRLLDVMLLEGLTVTVIRMGLALMHQCLPDLLNATDYGELMKIVTGTIFEISPSKEEELIQSICLFTDVNEQELRALRNRHRLLREVFTRKRNTFD